MGDTYRAVKLVARDHVESGECSISGIERRLTDVMAAIIAYPPLGKALVAFCHEVDDSNNLSKELVTEALVTKSDPSPHVIMGLPPPPYYHYPSRETHPFHPLYDRDASVAHNHYPNNQQSRDNHPVNYRDASVARNHHSYNQQSRKSHPIDHRDSTQHYSTNQQSRENHLLTVRDASVAHNHNLDTQQSR